MTDIRDLSKRANAAYDEANQLKREGVKQQKADDTYLGRVRDAISESQQLQRDVDQADPKTGEDLRFAGNATIMSFLAETTLLDLREQNYQLAQEELRDIETSAKQNMNRLGS